MLVLKKISIKKLAIYIFIIVLMVGSTGLMLYYNQGLAGQRPLVIDNLAQNDNPLLIEAVISGDQTAPSQPATADKIINNQGIDLTIFSTEKFKKLEKNTLINQENLGLGKRDIFKPN